MTAVEQRWRMVKHHLLHCCGGTQSAQRPPVLMLRNDLLGASAGYPAALQEVREAFAFGWGADMRALRGAAECCVPYLVDPIAACRAPLAVGLVHCSLVAAYTLAVFAFVHRCAWPTSRLQSLDLPQWSRFRCWPLPSPVGVCLTRASCASVLGSDSDDEVWWNPAALPPDASQYHRACFLAAHEGAEADAPHGQGALPEW